MKVLFLTNLLPYPLDNGGKIKTYTTLKALYDGGHKTDLVCFTEQDVKQKNDILLDLCDSVHEIYQRITTADNKNYMLWVAVKSMFSKYPLSSYKFISKEMILYLNSLSGKDYDLIYFDHLPLFVYYKTCKKIWPDARIILDEHNCEATIMRRNAETCKNRLKRMFMMYESFKVEKFESKAVLTADRTIVLSDIDYKTLKKATGKEFEHTIIPIGVIDKGVKAECANPDEVLKILFVGTLTWQPNNQGLIWFIDNIIPLLDKNKIKYSLYIVGKNPSSEVLQKTKGNRNIIVTGYVESVDPYYDQTDIMIVPLFIGSGQRVKLIEAFSKGMPSVSTTIGAEGLECNNGESILIADSKEMFLERIQLLADCDLRRHIGKNARSVYERNYSPEAISLKLQDAVKQ